MCEHVSVRVYLNDRILLRKWMIYIEQTIQNTRNSAFSYSGTLTHIYASVTIHTNRVSRLRNSNGLNKISLENCAPSLSLSLSVLYRCVYQIR